MRAQSSGPITAILMLVPLVAVPILAIFGIPQFAPLSASPSEESTDSGIDSPIEFDVGESASHSPHDLFSPFSDGTLATSQQSPDDPFLQLQQGNTRSPGDFAPERIDAEWQPPASALDGWSVEPGTRPRRFRDETNIASITNSRSEPPVDIALGTDDGNPFEKSNDNSGSFLPLGQFSAASANSEARSEWPDELFSENRNSSLPAELSKTVERHQPLTWQTAVKRLNEFGIQEYLLQPAEQPDEFHFSCFYTLADNPRITHRFEAEASEPLQAVGKVLRQIEERFERR